MSAPLRACVVGVGHLGRHHARILSDLPGAKLVAVVDSDQERGQSIAEKYKCAWHAEIGELHQQVDIAVIATPTILHEESARPFLRAGKSCLIEKPMAPDPDSCARILADAQAGGARVAVGHVERFNPAIRRARELGVRPRFIEAHRLAPYSFRSTDVGVVLDLMIHDIDLCLAWTGAEVTSVDAVGGATLSPSEDMASVRLHFSNGSAANLTASRLSLKPMRRFRFFGPDSYVSVDSGERYALLVRKAAGFSAEKVAEAAKSDNPVDGFQSLLHVEELNLDDAEPLRAELENFVTAEREGKPYEVTGEAGMAAVQVAHQVLDSLAKSAWDSSES